MNSTKPAKQTVTGKAFEYALLEAFYKGLNAIANVEVIKNAPYNTAEKCYRSFSDKAKKQYDTAASLAVDFLIGLEPRLAHDIDNEDVVQLEIVSDKEGQAGDVRDVLVIRPSQEWEIGISAKNNHRAVKHSRLSKGIDFGQKWLGIPCSSEYFNEIAPVFARLADLRDSSHATQTWHSLGNYHNSVYEPVLEALKKELESLDRNNPGIVAQRLVEYLIGTKDFYKVIKNNKGVEIQAYNLYGTLNRSFETVKPKAKINKLKLPTRIIEIAYEKATKAKNILQVSLDEEWQISFRIHNASSRIEPSLKFDINLVSSPHSLFTNHLFIDNG